MTNFLSNIGTNLRDIVCFVVYLDDHSNDGVRRFNVSRVHLLSIALVLLTAGIVAVILLARSGALGESAEDVERRHARDDSLFVTIDGVRLHYVDEGSGDTIVLLHGSYLDLTVWDEWADVLSSRMRVLRLDRSPFGLSGLDPSVNYGY